jgi:stress response protein YsnF
MKTVIAAFADQADADQARDRLGEVGLDPTIARVLAPEGVDVIDSLKEHGVPEDRAETYAELTRRGGSVVVVDVDDDSRAPAVAELLDRAGSLDLEMARDRWKSSGWQGYDRNAKELDQQAISNERTALARDLDVIEEQVKVGKRDVSRGGVRVRSFVTERPVNENVELRDEHIEVERIPEDQTISAGAADQAFTEEEFVVTATGEEPVVEKQARVVERVRVEKQAETHEEKIEDVERKREVEVEPVPPEAPRR